ncbi:hypothetical protein Hanom_Chr12g01140041 [Helianthus anomalus]
MSNVEKISKFADALPAEWDEFLKTLKKDSRFSNFYSNELMCGPGANGGKTRNMEITC